MARLATVLVFLSLVATRPLAAQSAADPVEADHTVVFELGWAGAWSHAEGWQTRGATFAFETTPIENKLEIESGVTAIWSPSGPEWSVDLLFKKPWTLAKGVEFMAGLGPEIGHGSGDGTFWGVSAVGDFMFWPRANVGWYLEPGFEADFLTGGARRGFAMAGGLIIGR